MTAQALPTFLGFFQPLPAAAGPGGPQLRAFGLDLGGGAPTMISGFQMQSQADQTEWCWAATSASIAAFYDPNTTLAQCSIATQVFASLGRPLQCCGADRSACNAAQSLTDVLNFMGNLRGDSIQSAGIPYSDLCQEVQTRHPLAIRIGWPPTEENGHFIAVVGYLIAPDQTEFVVVQDPAAGNALPASKTISLDDLTNNYEMAGGKWDYSYKTKATGD